LKGDGGLDAVLSQAKYQLNQLYENACNASLDTGGDSNESDDWLGGDGNGSEDEADEMSEDEGDGDDISEAWEERFCGLFSLVRSTLRVT
jgi:hypothetical protein